MSQIITPDLNELAGFLVKAKKQTYAGDGREIEPQRPGFKELEFIDGDWNYRDSYVGYYCAPGQEVVRFQGKPVWAMSYDGGIVRSDWGNLNLAKNAFFVLKQALSQVNESRPFRGPSKVWIGNHLYQNEVEGDITRFNGREEISLIDKIIFEQKYLGGLIVPK